MLRYKHPLGHYQLIEQVDPRCSGSECFLIFLNQISKLHSLDSLNFLLVMHSASLITALVALTPLVAAQPFLSNYDLSARDLYLEEVYARDFPDLEPRTWQGVADAKKKIQTGIKDGVASVENSKSAGGHNPVPPMVGAIAGFAEGVGAVCSKTTGKCSDEPAKTALQTKVGKNPAEMKAANALNAANTAKGFGETSQKKIEGAKKIGKVEGAVFAASNALQDKLRAPKAGSPLAKQKGKRALVARAVLEELYARELEARDFNFGEEWY